MLRRFKIGDTVRVVRCRYNHKYIGLVGKIIWVADRGGICQISTCSRPPYYRPRKRPWIITIRFEELQFNTEEIANNCKHHWILDKDNQGVCKLCGAIKDFRTLLIKEGVLPQHPERTEIFGV